MEHSNAGKSIVLCIKLKISSTKRGEEVQSDFNTLAIKSIGGVRHLRVSINRRSEYDPSGTITAADRCLNSSRYYSQWERLSFRCSGLVPWDIALA